MKDITEKKQILRKQLQQKRESMTSAEWQRNNNNLLHNAAKWFSQHAEPNFLIFSGFGKEPNLCLQVFVNLLPQSTKLYLPVVDSRNVSMKFYLWKPGDILKPNRYGILEPTVRSDAELNYKEAFSIIIPALAADHGGNRLGYGKGYYDRFLSQHQPNHSAIVLFSAFVLNEIPTDAHDVRVGHLITEAEITKTN